MITKQDRFRGTLIGVLVGDALGAPYETMKSEAILADMERRGGLTLFDYENPWKHESQPTFPKGRPTDDSDQTAALAQSLIACNGFNEEDVFNRLRRVTIDQKSPLWDGVACGAGRTTRTMLTPSFYEESLQVSSKGAFPSNGSLMRASPMALFLSVRYPDSPIYAELVRSMSNITHRHLLAGECCIAYTSILMKLLTDKYYPEDAVSITRFELIVSSDLENILKNPTTSPRDPEVWPGRGAALLTLHVALWALLTTSSFREGMTKIITFGGDTDTYAAVGGALLGAHYGESSIPDEWREPLIGREVMEQLADQLLEMGNTPQL